MQIVYSGTWTFDACSVVEKARRKDYSEISEEKDSRVFSALATRMTLAHVIVIIIIYVLHRAIRARITVSAIVLRRVLFAAVIQ